MDRWIGKVALVTGASSGIGKATAVKLLQHGMKVVGCGRREDALQALQTEIGSLGELTTIPCDVGKEEDVVSMFSQIKVKYGGIDVCINSAGLNRNNTILGGKSEDWQLIFDVNVMGVLRVTREAVASMKDKPTKEGHIININSVVGHTIGSSPQYFALAASKHAVKAITNGTRFELLAEQPAFNCRVSQICPGLTESSFIASSMGEENAAAVYSSAKALNAEDIADTVIYQLGLSPHAQVQDVIVKPF